MPPTRRIEAFLLYAGELRVEVRVMCVRGIRRGEAYLFFHWSSRRRDTLRALT